MSELQPAAANFESRVRESFKRQRVMDLLGAHLLDVSPGAVDIELAIRADPTQQHGYLHAGIITTIVDSACGFAAFTLMPEGTEVLAVEFKVNLLAPARGESVRAEGRVLKAGRTLTVCEGVVLATHNDTEQLVATMTATMMAVADPKL